MATTLPQWNGPTTESQNCQVRGRPTSDNRHILERLEDRPKIESFQIAAGLASPDVSVMIVADGKRVVFRGNRLTVMKILAQASEALFKMEPGR